MSCSRIRKNFGMQVRDLGTFKQRLRNSLAAGSNGRGWSAEGGQSLLTLILPCANPGAMLYVLPPPLRLKNHPPKSQKPSPCLSARIPCTPRPTPGARHPVRRTPFSGPPHPLVPFDPSAARPARRREPGALSRRGAVRPATGAP